jgi:hypothetical protein
VKLFPFEVAQSENSVYEHFLEPIELNLRPMRLWKLDRSWKVPCESSALDYAAQRCSRPLARG